MRKLIVSNLATVDGFFAGPNREIDWFIVDKEFISYSEKMLNSADLLLFGRITYQVMVSYWSTQHAITNDPVVAERMNNLAKIVFSKTLQGVEWNNTKLATQCTIEEIETLKQQPGKDIVVLGSAQIASALTQLGLVDEYRIILNPLILGAGKPLFGGIDGRLPLQLLRSATHKSGNLILYYRPIKSNQEVR